MPVTKADLRRFVKARTVRKIQEIRNIRSEVVKETLEPFFQEEFKALPLKEINNYSIELAQLLDITSNHMINVGSVVESIMRALPENHDYASIIRNYYIKDVTERLNKKETDYHGFDYLKTHEDSYNKQYITYAFKVKENCAVFARQIKAVKSLEEELLVIIKSASTAKKAYEKLETFGLDLSTLKPEVVHLPEITKLSQDISLLN